ncbi:MAG: hypothetical protein R3E68_01940 [Burkholderiaceae bacterium]
MTATLIAVYVPIGLQESLPGRCFASSRSTLAGAVAISGIVALTLSPVSGRQPAQAPWKGKNGACRAG